MRLACISIRQPWALCITHGGKRVENRVSRTHRSDGVPVQPTAHRGPICLHTSRRIDSKGLRDPRIQDLMARLGPEVTMPTGAIVAIAHIVDVHYDTGTCCGVWAARGQWHLALSSVQVLDTPVPARGALSLPWFAPSSVTTQVLDQIKLQDTAAQALEGKESR